MAGNGKVGNLFFGINLDSREFKKGMKKVKRNMKKFQKDMKAGFDEIGKGALALTAGITTLSAGVLKLTKDQADLVNAQDILAKSLGSTQAEIAGLELAADSMGVSYDMLVDKMREFGGVDAFKGYADDVKNAGNATDQLAKAQEIFGNEGLKLLPILQQGSQGLDDYVLKAKELGLALNANEVDQMVTAWGAYESAMQRVTGITRKLSVESSGAFEDLALNLDAFVNNNMEEIIVGAKRIADAFRIYFSNSAIAVNYLMDEFKAFIQDFGSEISILEALIIGIQKPFEVVLMTMIKASEKFLSIVSYPFRALAGIMIDAIDLMGDIAQGLINLVPGGSNQATDFLNRLTEATKELKSEFATDDVTGAFDGLVFSGFQDEFKSEIDDILKQSRKVGKQASMEFQKGLEDIRNTSTGKAMRELIDAPEAKTEVTQGSNTMAVAGSITAFNLENQKSTGIEEQQLSVQQKMLRGIDKMSRSQQLQIAGFTS